MAAAFRSMWNDPRRKKAKAMLRRKQASGQLRTGADLDITLDALSGPLYFRFPVKDEPPSQKYAEALVDLVIRGWRKRPVTAGKLEFFVSDAEALQALAYTPGAWPGCQLS